MSGKNKFRKEIEEFLDANPRVTYFDRQYILNDHNLERGADDVLDIIMDFIDDPKIQTLGCKSTFETGKTSMLKKIIEKCASQKILCFTHRKHSSKKLYPFEDLGFVNYLDVEGSLYTYDKVVVHVDSIHRLRASEDSGIIFKEYDLVIIDEITNVMHEHAKYPDSGTRFEDMETIMDSAWKVILLDSEFNRIFKILLEKYEYRLIYNEYDSFRKKFKLSGDKKLFINEIFSLIDSGKNICLIVDSNAQAKAFSQLISKVKPDTKQCLHTDEIDLQLNEEHEDVNTYWNQFQVLIYPMIIKGDADFHIEHFDKMFYASGDAGSDLDYGYFMRTISRIRRLKSGELLVL